MTEKPNKEQASLMRYSREEISASVGFKDFFDATENLEMAGVDLATAELDGRELVGVKVRSEERMALGRLKTEVEKRLGKTPVDDQGAGGRPPVDDQGARNREHLDTLDRSAEA